ncbi:MAG: hypothetical protein ISQ14_14230 [Verrucomicrobiae bacterium]|nr:hypothetical protein [Verrucomicrobiae bacterium]
MKDQLPSPDFDSENYDRPNQPWQCGWAASGHACARGPDGSGRCRATYECRPLLKKKSDADTGEWVCTRPRSQGGSCGDGPRPDGTCGCPIPPCQPEPSLRTRRGRISIMVTAATLAALVLIFFQPDYGRFISPGEVSSYHSGPTFVSLKKTTTSNDNCAACHTGAEGGPRAWLRASLTGHPKPWELGKILEPHHDHLTSIDRSCLACHPAHGFHQPNVTREHSCALCHLEHQGQGRMPPPRDINCASCHNHEPSMNAARVRAKALPEDAFHYWKTSGLILPPTARPPEGFTTVFDSFSKGHPEFQIHREKLSDGNSLRFNHQLHLGERVRTGTNSALKCADCHTLDATGNDYQRVSFETHCRQCHSLQFDPGQPGLTLPHGAPAQVRSFLASLPAQYADLARRQGRSTEPEINEFVQDQFRRLQSAGLSGESLQRQVFLSGDPSKQTASLARELGARSNYAGCAYCHSVATSADSHPVVIPPAAPDRWLIRGRFNHAKHLNVSCRECHAVHLSRQTADISLPTKASCANCHSPAGGVSESCSLCHSYHNLEKRQ